MDGALRVASAYYFTHEAAFAKGRLDFISQAKKAD
jgi:hypothetical protein